MLHGFKDFNIILFDDYCKYVFAPSGTINLVVVSFTNPLDLRTDPLQEGRDDVTSLRLTAWAIS